MDFDLIIPGLYLGNMQIDLKVLKSLNIVQILSMGFDYSITDAVPCEFIAVCDEPSENLYMHFDNTFDCINRILIENGNIYVHCIAGVSRSATVVAAYLMKRNHWSLCDAIDLIKSKRSIVEPNVGFLEQLRLYQSILNFFIL
jgi:protein-tyrosine phosphatase